MIPRRTVLAAFLAPLVVPLAMFGFLLATGSLSGSGAMMVLTGSYLAAIIGMATVGVPALLLLSACVRISIMSLALVGVLSGLIYFNVIMSCFAYVLESSVGATAISSWWGGFFGVLVALTFGLLAGRPTVDGEGA